jgi:glyceraldehyde 3-phosphate dehydrogenase
MAKIAINGFGRIGRQVFKRLIKNHKKLEVVAINDLTDTKTLAHLLKYDSVYGRSDMEISHTDNSIKVDGKEIKVFAEKDPQNLPWKELKVDIVLECSGQFTEGNMAGKHIIAGAKSIIISAPSKDDGIPSYVLGVNEDKFEFESDKIIDMGSCTTNCIAPVAKVLNDNFGIVKGFMTTAHSYTNDQRILDLPHKDLRRARAAAINIIPTTTGAAKALGKVIPELKGKLDGLSLRVPTADVSIIDLVVELKKPVLVQQINDAFIEAEKKMKGILATEKELLVSSDFIEDSHSATVDLASTMVIGNMVKVLAWYDNEWGYSCRLAEFAEFVSRKM